MLRVFAIFLALCAAGCTQDMDPSPGNPDGGGPAQDAATGQPDAAVGLDAAPGQPDAAVPQDAGLDDGGLDDGGLDDGGLDDGGLPDDGDVPGDGGATDGSVSR